MKKPTKKPQLIDESCFRFDVHNNKVTPQKIRDWTYELEEEGVKYIEFCSSEYNFEVVQYRYETPKEAEKRYNRKIKQYNTHKKRKKENKEKRKQNLIKEAEKLGLKVEDKSDVTSNNL